MLVFYCCFGGEWYGSGVTFVMLQSSLAYKEQLVAYYGVIILLNIRNIVGQEVYLAGQFSVQGGRGELVCTKDG